MPALELLFYYCAFMDADLHRPQLSMEDKRRRDRRTPRIALCRYSQSAFVYLFESGNEQALLNCTACDHKVFQHLLSLFERVFNQYSFDDKTGLVQKLKLSKNGMAIGRRTELTAVRGLGLVLYWFRT